MPFGESCDDLIKNWLILVGLLLHWMDYVMIPYAQSTNTTGNTNCFIIEEKWSELMHKRGTFVETNLIEKYKNFEKIKENREITSLVKFIELVNKTDYDHVLKVDKNEKHEKILPNYSEPLKHIKLIP